MIAVVDTNVLLSAAMRDRLPEQVVLYVARAGRMEMDRHAADSGRVRRGPAAAASLRDPKDAPFLAAALAGRADYLITGDRDLLAAKDVVPARIVTVAEFAREFGVA